jgi:hypothetical protein
VVLEDIGPDQTLNAMLAGGEIDAFMGPRAPSSFVSSNKTLCWLFEDPTQEAMNYFRRTRIFPIMHLVGVRRSIVERQPWLPMALLKAFERSKHLALQSLADTSATKVALPFVEEQLRRAHSLMGEDFWPYGPAGQSARARSLRQATITRRESRRGSSASRNCFIRRRSRATRSETKESRDNAARRPTSRQSRAVHHLLDRANDLHAALRTAHAPMCRSTK